MAQEQDKQTQETRIIDTRCPSCGHAFKVRIPDQAPAGGSYMLSYRCPKCGREFSERPGASAGQSASAGRGSGSGGQGGTSAGHGAAGSGRTGSGAGTGKTGAGGAGGPKWFGGEKPASSLKYIIGIPLVILAVVAVGLAIAGRFTDVSPVMKELGAFTSRFSLRNLSSQDTAMWISRIFVLFVCFPVHECAHAWTAEKLGDPTGRRRGRITLNPFKHLDLWGTITILLFGVGYAKPVPVNINNFKNRKRDFAITALAGPVSNLLMAVIFLLLVRFLMPSIQSSEAGYLAAQSLVYAAYINISLAVFNLIPIPPLDGSRVLTALLPDNTYNSLLRLERYSMVILLVALMLFNRMGYSPIGIWSGKVFQWMYRLIVGG